MLGSISLTASAVRQGVEWISKMFPNQYWTKVVSVGLSRSGSCRPASAPVSGEESASCHVFVWVEGLVLPKFEVLVPFFLRQRKHVVKFAFSASGEARRLVQQVPPAPAVSESESRKRARLAVEAAGQEATSGRQ